MVRGNEAASGRTKRAYEYVKEQLLDGMYMPGQRLPVASFVVDLSMSRQPVLTALRQLAAEKLIEIVPQVGCLAARHAPRDIADLFRWLATSEGLMAALAAERGDAQGAVKLSQAVQESDSNMAHRVDDSQFARAYRRANRRIHELIHEMAASPLLSESVVRLWDRSDYYKITRSSATGFEMRRNDLHSEHKKIAAAIKRGDAEKARSLMEAHILASISAR